MRRRNFFGIPLMGLFSRFKHKQPLAVEVPEFDYHYMHDIQMDGEMWAVYGLEDRGNPVILHPKTFEPIRPLNPIRFMKRIAQCRKTGRIREIPFVLVKNQEFEYIFDGSGSLAEDDNTRIRVHLRGRLSI